MKTLQTKEIDGFQIITGFQTRPIDPEATRKSNIPKIMSISEYSELNNKQKEQVEFREKATAAKRQEKNFIVVRKEQLAKKQNLIYLESNKSVDACNEDLKGISKRINEKAKIILRENPVYFGLRKGEVEKTEIEILDLEEKFKDKPSGQQLQANGIYIQDLRGKACFIKTGDTWEKSTIKNLGDGLTELGRFWEDLSMDEQSEVGDQKDQVRISSMPPEEKQSEFEAASEGKMLHSINMRSRLEIEGVSAAEALVQSQAFYADEVEKLKLEYGVV